MKLPPKAGRIINDASLMVKKAPTEQPKGVRASYEYLSYPGYYEGESTEEFVSRMNMREAFEDQLVAAKLTIDELAAMEAGVIIK